MTRVLLLGFFLMAGLWQSGNANAQSIQCSQSGSCDQGEAFAECMNVKPANNNIISVSRRVCHLRQSVRCRLLLSAVLGPEQ